MAEDKCAPMTCVEYVAKGGMLCPFCRSEEISADTISSEGTEATQSVECKTCGREWVDVFYLKAYLEVEAANGS